MSILNVNMSSVSQTTEKCLVVQRLFDQVYQDFHQILTWVGMVGFDFYVYFGEYRAIHVFVIRDDIKSTIDRKILNEINDTNKSAGLVDGLLSYEDITEIQIRSHNSDRLFTIRHI